ncbi:HupE/UreJ family protein [Paucibacter sp. PLA-PC-4]|uniref:HupE/UreJ family protein n=1 Tax=Paucibacter sp. PLA-PC-4 TaxID=2993655 RepID=UPI00224894F2|nr:HupE/UreJ family protein [Paucibacter sp. PLA-PC-4]MCX2862108.1 HupE/UreJ family protein [Paucibacter sp. PLA-PC-4]
MKALTCLLSGLLWLFALPALAHKPSDAYLRLSLQGATLEQRLDIALRDLDRELDLDADADGVLRWGELRQRTAAMQALAEQGLDIDLRDAKGRACLPSAYRPLQIAMHSDGRYAVLSRSWNCESAAQDLTLSYRLFAASDPTHRGIARLERGAEAAVLLVLAPDGRPQQLQLGEDAAALGLGGFFLEGVHHIWIGVDHVLFLLVLLLPAVLLRLSVSWAPAPVLRPALVEVVGVVTAFTVAHSITLGLAVFGVLDPPSRWVESLIAASVLLAALNNLYPVVKQARWKLSFGFGLIHGFGFAGALRDLGLGQSALAGPLLMFNLGVEAGQLAIVAVFVPIAWRLRTQRLYARWLLGGGSLLAAVLALVWLLERAFDLRMLELS